jgi:hypothetical protein
MPWFEGNLHCHTTNSDGDSSPAFVAEFYKKAGFDFVAITDHNHFTKPEETKSVCGPQFLHLPASEYTGISVPGQYCHVNGLGISKPFHPSRIEDALGTLKEGVSQAQAQGALAMLNHPNWKWAYGAKEIAAAGAEIFELYNGSYTCNNEGSEGRPGTEAMWDEVLSQGIRIWGAGSDDCHRHSGHFDPFKDPPCSAWSVVEAEELSVKAILAALKAGRFYATTRVRLESIEAGKKKLELRVRAWDGVEFYTDFIGKGGKLLKRVSGQNPHYEFKGDEIYVRAKVMCSDRHMAWTQPVFV